MRVKSKLHSSVIILVVVAALLALGCANIFSEMADKTTYKARLYEARKKLGSGDWDAAIEQIELMSSEHQALREVVTLKASAYAGKCGLNFIEIAEAMQNGGASSMMSILLTGYTGKVLANVAHCITAEDLLKTIGDHTVRNTEENLLMAFVALTKMGAVLNALGDADADGSVDAGWNPCDGSGATDLPDDATPANKADATELATGFGLFITSIVAAGAQDAAGQVFTDLNTFCAAAGNPCTVVNRADVTATQRRGVRALVVENTDGIGLGIEACDTATCFAGACSAF